MSRCEESKGRNREQVEGGDSGRGANVCYSSISACLCYKEQHREHIPDEVTGSRWSNVGDGEISRVGMVVIAMSVRECGNEQTNECVGG